MSEIDAIDVVSLLLGFAIVPAALSSFGRGWFRGASDSARIMIAVGAALLLGYVISEAVQALRVVHQLG